MENNEYSTVQVIEKKDSKIISQLARKIERVVNHKTLEKIIKITEEEEGID